MKGVGARFWEWLKRDAPLLQEALRPGTITGVEYTDRYVNSPLAAVLLASLMDGLRAYQKDHAPIRIILADTLPAPRYAPLHVFNNWPDASERTNVLRKLFEETGVAIRIEERSRTRMEHARKLTLQMEGGQALVIWLDQGLGFWRVARGPSARHDFQAPAAIQARQLLKNPMRIAAPPGQATYVHARFA